MALGTSTVPAVSHSKMMEHRPWALRGTAWVLVALGLLWIACLAVLALLGRGVRGPCGSTPPWESEHTLAVVVGLLGLGLPPLLRRTGRTARTLVHGRCVGGIDVALHTVPVIAAAIALLCSTSALLTDFRCCMVYEKLPLPWWAGWQCVSSFGVCVVVGLTGTSR